MNTASTSGSGTLPGDTIANPKEEDECVEETYTDPDHTEYNIKVPPPPPMTLEFANCAICTPDGITRDVFVPVGKFTFLADFVVVDYESDPRVPLILGRSFLRIARTLIDVHGEEMILRDGYERLTLNMKHDTASYSNHPYRDSVNLINIFNFSSEDCLKDLVSHKQSGNPTFLLHKKIASPEVIPEFHDSNGCFFLSEELPDIDSFNDIHLHFDDDPLSGSTTFLASSLLEEFADELALISYPLDYDDNRACNIESDIREIEFLLFQGEDSDFKDSIDQSVLTHPDDLFVDPTPEMFAEEQPPDYSFLSRFDVYPDDFLEIESDANFDDDLFDSEGEKIKEAELLIDQLDLPCDILSEYDSFSSQDFSRDDVLFSPDNEDKVVTAAKLPILNPNEFDLWKMRIEQYFLMTDYSLWEVILNADSPIPTRVVDGVVQPNAPTTAEQRLAKKNKLKARGTLLMALLDKHQLKFNIHKDAKSLMKTIEKRFGGNKKTKKVKKTFIKQQYVNFTGSSSESLDQIHDRLQKLISQLEILGKSLSQEDINLKFLRSVPSEWRTHTLIWRNKVDLEDRSLDDLFNNLKIYEAESVSDVASVFAASTKPLAFILPNVDNLSDARTGRNLGANRTTSIGFDMSKVECYNYHRRGHFEREYRSPKDTRNKDTQRRNFPMETSTFNAFVSQCDGVGSYDWSFQADEEPTTYALMAYTSSSSSSSDNEVTSCFKACSKAYSTLQSHYDKLTIDFRKSQLDVISYKSGLQYVEARLVVYQQNENVFGEGLGYDNQMFNSIVVDSAKLNSYEKFYALKPDLVFYDAPTVSETVPIVINDKPSTTKSSKVMYQSNRPSTPIIEDWVSDSEDESEGAPMPTQKAPSFVQTSKHVKTPRTSIEPARMAHPHSNEHVVPTAILTRSRLVPLNTARPVTTVVPQTIVKHQRPAKQVVNKPHSPIRRPINYRPAPKNSNFPHKVTTVKPKMVNVVQGVKGNWVWKPKCPVLDHVSRLTSVSVTFKQFDYTDALGRSKHVTGNISYLSDFEEINGGYVAFGGNPKGGKITGKDTECIVLSSNFKLPDDNHVLLRVSRENNMYNVDLKNIVHSEDLTYLFAKATLDESNLWHRRLGHINFKTMNKLVKGNLVRGLPSKVFENNHTCVACKKGKQHRASCKTKLVSSVSQPLQRLHMDLFGPTFVKSLNKKSYCLVVTDDYNRFSWVFFLATKDETSTILKTFITGIENQISHKVKIIKSDNGTEFKNHDFNQFCGMKRIKREFSVARTPQQNGIAKRKNRTLIEATRTMLANSLLPIPFWAEAVNTDYVQNKVLVTKPYNRTPYELLLGRTPSIGFMRPFSCPVTILNILKPLRKFDGKADEGFLVGYSTSSKAFRVFNSRTRIVHETLHINFLENQPNVAGSIQENLNACTYVKEAASVQQYVLLPLWSTGSKDPQNTDVDDAFDVKEPDTNGVNAVSTPVIAIGPNSTNSTNTFNVAGPANNLVSPTFEIGGKSSIVDHSQYPDDPNMPALEDITYSDNEEDEEGIDYEEVFARVVRIESIRLFLAYASFMGFMVYQMDVKSAFLYGTIEEKVYFCQPLGSEDPDYPDKVYKVVKALYVLHQAPRAWYETLANYLLENSLQRGKID
nr:putative ribonuclease H-like domain-containing protein [Tanacetum cinerariifolium]